MFSLLIVMLGGAIGSGARYLTSVGVTRLLGPNYPYGILTVNLVGCFLMGLLAGVLVRLSVPGETWRLLLGVGVLGGYTTFSSFSLDIVTQLQRGDWPIALGYVLLSVMGGVLALFAGLALVRTAT